MEPYKKVVERSAETRILIDREWGSIRVLANFAERIFNISKKTFMLIHKATYYTHTSGEYARLYREVEHFANTLKYLKAFNLDETINSFLKEQGISVTIEKPVEIEFDKRFLKSERTQRQLKKIFRYRKELPTEPEAVMNMLLCEAHNIQRDICGMADSIKLSDAFLVKELYEIERPHFIKATRILADKIKMKNEVKKTTSTKKKVSSVEKGMESMRRSISIFKKSE